MAEKRFSEKKYVLPFGRYVGSTEVEPPADEVLVGREGQRAYLIDLLISSGRRGAYLVTGHRGAGKTSFVKYCISEYEASVFSRFLRGNVGRGVWDRVLVLLFWMSILIGALLATEVVQFFVSSSTAGDENLLQCVILLPIGVILLYPCVYAKVVLETCIRAAAKRATVMGSVPNAKKIERDVSRWAGGAAFLIVLVLSIAIWIAPYSGRPAQGVSLLIPVICALYATVQAVSFRRKGERGDVWARGIFVFLAVALVSALYESSAMSSLIASYPQASRILEDEVPRYAFRGNLALGLIFLGLGSILRSWDQLERLGLLGSMQANALKDAIAWGARWYYWFGYVVFFSGCLLLAFVMRYEALWRYGLQFVMPACLLGVFFWKRETSQEEKRSEEEANGTGTTWSFQPRPTWILTAKAIVSIVIALQLAYPVISVLSPTSVSSFFRGLGLGLCQPTSLCGVSLSQNILFTGRMQEKFWLGALLIFIIIFHIIEYEWIIRPYVRSREGQAFGAGGLAPWDEREPDTAPAWRRRALHSLAELTLPWQTYKAWLPVLPIAVNLGFDRLDHRRVIQTMLVGLRERYHRAFLAWNSSFANLGRFLGLLVLVTLTASIGRLIPTPEKPKPLPGESYKISFELPTPHESAGKEGAGKGKIGRVGIRRQDFTCP